MFRQDRGILNIDNAYEDPNDNDDENNIYVNRRGGGILVAFKRNDLISFERDQAEDLFDNIMNFSITQRFLCENCKKSAKFAFTVIYRRPGRFKNQSMDMSLF